MKSYIPHFYEYRDGDWETLNELARSVLVDTETGKKKVDIDPEKFRLEGDCIIDNAEDRLHLCFSDDEVVRIPEGVRAIASGAFDESMCPNVKHIILSNTVVGLAQCAISGHTVEELTINNKYIYISDLAFDHCPTLRLIHHVPAGVTIRVQKKDGRCARPVKFETMESPEIEEDDADCDDNDLPF